MSMNSLANAAIARRTDFMPLGRAPQGLGEIAAASASVPVPVPAGGSPQPGAVPVVTQYSLPSSNAVNTAMNVLFGYIPGEALTLYVAIVAAIHQPAKVSDPERWTFWAFVPLTVLIQWTLYAAKVKADQKPVPWRFSQWPKWEMFAAGVGYFAWAFALPTTPMTEYLWYSPAIAAIVLLVASTLLALLAPFFQQQIKQ